MCQLRRKPARRHRSLGAQKATQKSSDLSKPPWGTSPHFVPTTRFVYDPRLTTIISHNFQETVAVGNRISNLLSRIVTLEDCFDSRPSDVAERRRRDDLIRCGATSILYSRVHFLLASSIPLRNNCGCFPRSLGCFCLLTMSKPGKMHSGFSKISKRQSSTIRFVHDLTLFSPLTGTADDATDNLQQSRFKGNSKCSHFRLGKRSNLSSQDPGWIIFCLCVPMTIAS